jgi:nicotinamide phosphoribosyltransferase
MGAESEKLAFENMISSFGDNSLLYACVSDSWDFKEAIQTWIGLKDKVLAKKANLVIRPDSGDAIDNIMYALVELEKGYGCTVNSKGYKVLNKVGLIQGDGVNIELIKSILNVMKEAGFSAENIAFGMGGALLQGNFESSINRDTFQFAMKCSAIQRGDKIYDVYKDPVDDKAKKSKKGRLDLIKNDSGEYETIMLDDSFSIGNYHPKSELVTYYDNGQIMIDQSLKNIKQRS